MRFCNEVLEQWTERFLGIGADGDGAGRIVPAAETFALASLRGVDSYLVSLYERTQTQLESDPQYIETAKLAGAYAGDVLRALAKRDLNWVAYEDAVAACDGNAEALGEPNEFNAYVLISPAGDVLAPIALAAAIVYQGDVYSLARLAAEQSAIMDDRPAGEAFAAAKLQEIQQLEPWEKSELTGETASDQRVWARHYLRHQRDDLAEAALFDALDADPFCLPAYCDLGDIEAQRGRDDRALACFRRCLAIDPQYGAAHHARAQFYHQRGKLDLAVSDMRQAVSCAPKSVDWHETLASYLGDQGRHDDAAEVLQAAAEAAPAADDGLRHAILASMALQLARTPQVDRALEVVSQVIAEDQRLYGEAPVSAYLARAQVLLALARWQEAAADYVRAAKIDESGEHAYAGLAWIWSTAPAETLRQPEKALLAARKAQQLAKRDSFNVWEALAAANARCGKFDEAVRAQQQALQVARRCDRAAAEQRLRLYELRQPYTAGAAS